MPGVTVKRYPLSKDVVISKSLDRNLNLMYIRSSVVWLVGHILAFLTPVFVILCDAWGVHWTLDDIKEL